MTFSLSRSRLSGPPHLRRQEQGALLERSPIKGQQMYKENTNLQQLRFHHGPWYLSGSYLTRKCMYLRCMIGQLRACDQRQTTSSWLNGHGYSDNSRSKSDTLKSKWRQHQISEKCKGHVEKPWVKFQSCYVENGT